MGRPRPIIQASIFNFQLKKCPHTAADAFTALISLLAETIRDTKPNS